MTLKSLWLLVICLATSVWIACIALASVPYNPLSLPFDEKCSIFIITPQGWGFFTRDPREPEFFFFQKKGDRWDLLTMPGASPSNLFGISRKNRKLLFEQGLVLNDLKRIAPPVDSGNILDFRRFGKLKPLELTNHSMSGILKGEFIVLEKQNVPWAWSSNYSEVHMPYKAIHLFIK